MNALTTTNSTDVMTIVGQMDGLMQLGDTLVRSGMLPKSVATKEAAVAIMLKGRELGIGPLEAFSSINVIQGKPTIAPQLMIALAERSGALKDYQITDDGKTCACTVTRRGRAPFSASFSMEDAKAMGLAGKDNWNKQPKVMRQWRAVSAAFRVVFADVLAGLYIPEEMGATVDDEGQIVVDDAVIEDAPANGHAEPEPRPYMDTAAGIALHDKLDKAKAYLGEDVYYTILGNHGIEHRTEIRDQKQADRIMADLRGAVPPKPEQTDLVAAVDGQPD